jgi:hypothetical protein
LGPGGELDSSPPFTRPIQRTTLTLDKGACEWWDDRLAATINPFPANGKRVMARRQSLPRDRDHEDHPRRPNRRRAKKKGGAGTVVLLGVLGIVLLVGAGVVVSAVLLVKGARPVAEKGDRKDFKAELADRFVGTWEGGSPERPSLQVYLDVTRDRVTLKAFNTRTREWGDKPLVSMWRASRTEGDNTLIIAQERTDGSRTPYESVIAFTSGEAMSMTSRESGRLVANFRRAGKR